MALTWPYYHDGSVGSLGEAITKMARFQVGRKISANDCGKIESYLEALTGEYQGRTLTNMNMQNENQSE